MAFTRTDLSKGSSEGLDPNFPRHVYHADGRWVPVKDDAAWRALGPGWGHPNDAVAAPEPEPADDDSGTAAPPKRKKGRA